MTTVKPGITPPSAEAILHAAETTLVTRLAAIDNEGRQSYVSPAFCAMVGWRADELIGQRAPFVYWPAEELEAIRAAFAATVEGRAPPEGFELCFHRKSGERFFAQVAISPLVEGGERVGWLASLFEIDERKQLAAERAEREHQEQARRLAEAERRRLSEILDHMPAGVMIADAATGATIYSNRQARQIFGGPIPETQASDQYSSTFAVWHPDGQPLESEKFPLVRAVNGETVEGQEVHFRRPNGEIAIVRANAAPIRDERGAVVAAVTAYYDVTAQVTLERTIEAERASNVAAVKASEARYREVARAIGESEQRFRTLAEATSTIVWQTGADGRIVEPSPSWIAFTGQAKETWTPGAGLAVMHPDELDEVKRVWADALVKGIPFEIECRVRRHDGQYVPMSVRATPVVGEDGTIREWIGSNTDITDRLALLESERAARRDAERARQRMALLDAITTGLVGELDDSTAALERLTQVVVPELADWCTVYVTREDGEIAAVAVGHADPSRARAALEMLRAYPVDATLDWGVAKVIRTGRAENIADIDDALLVAASQGAAHLEAMRSAGMSSHLAVPMSVRGKVIGCLGLTNSDSGRQFDADDLALAEEVAVRAALTIERARLYQEMKRARAEAEAANRSKDVFLAMLGHELRNPLAPILTAIELMRLREPEAFRKERSIVERQVHHLVRLVDDLLDVSRITRGKIELEKRPIEVADAIAKGIEMSSSVLEQQRHHLEVAVPSQGLRIDADHARLAQVFCNLVSNAAKYTRPGGTITVRAACEDDMIVVRVKDDGEGIDAQLLPRVFDLFEQSERTLERAQGGLGIGLTIVKTLVELHGGSVSAHSDGKGQGSEFEVRLPASKTARAGASEQPAVATRPVRAQRGVRVLLVDDNQDAVVLLAEALEALGYETRVAHDGPSGIAAATEFSPVVAMLDIGLPVMDGYELAQRLRQQLDGIRLVAMTGYGQESDQQRTREIGFEHHLVKPLSLERVASILDEFARSTP